MGASPMHAALAALHANRSAGTAWVRRPCHHKSVESVSLVTDKTTSPSPVPADAFLPKPTAPVAWTDPYDVSYRRQWLLLGLLIALTAVAFLPSLSGSFLWGDDRVVANNQAIKSIHTLRFAWRHPKASALYRPVADSLLFVEHRLWATWNPTGYRVVSLALHLGNVYLVWLLLRRVRLRGAIAAAALFALHPLAVQPVAWVQQQPIVLA